MPLYQFACHCGARFTHFYRIADRNSPTQCACGELAERQISAPMVTCDYEGYHCPVTEKWIEGKRAHEENLKRTNSRVYEPGEFERNKKIREQREKAFDDQIGETVERMVTSLPSREKERLACEMSHGVDINLSRTTATTGV